jgi:predicted nucleic acid-binding protein
MMRTWIRSSGLPETICDTSPLQYLHQLQRLDLLPALVGQVTIPPIVTKEIADGLMIGIDLPDIGKLNWITERAIQQVRPEVNVYGLDHGETEVLTLALEIGASNARVIIDELPGRGAAVKLGINLIGTLGLLINAKARGILPAVKPELDRLDALGFRLAKHTREAVLKAAAE